MVVSAENKWEERALESCGVGLIDIDGSLDVIGWWFRSDKGDDDEVQRNIVSPRSSTRDPSARLGRDRH